MDTYSSNQSQFDIFALDQTPDNELPEKLSNVYGWKDIHANAVTHQEFAEEALNQIKFQLGYLPKRQVTLPDEPFVRHAFYEFIQHGNYNKLEADCEPHILNIYERDMKPHAVNRYPQNIFDAYKKFLPEYGETTRNRIIKFLGCEPHLNHSVYAELLLRKNMANITVHLGEEETEYDIEVLTIIEFRQFQQTDYTTVNGF